MRTRWTVVGIGLAAVAAVVGWLLLRDTTTPVERAEVIATFIGEAGDAPGEPGIYRYRTAGFESIDALQGARHDYPGETYMTISDGSCGPLVKWQALAERWIEWSHCGTDLAIDQTIEYHQWFGIPDEERERCDPARSIARDVASVVCTASGSTETYSVEVVGTESLQVGRETVVTTHLKRTSVLGAGSTGSTTADVWRLEGTTLVVRAVWASTSVTPSAAGDVTYIEHVTLDLIDLLPTG